MSELDSGNLKYAYVKNGDAVDQVSRILSAPDAVSTSGPDAFLADFLSRGSYARVRVLSRHRRSAQVEFPKVGAEVACDGRGGVGKLIRRPLIFCALIVKLLMMRPDRILCGSTGSRLWAAYLVSRMLGVPMLHSRHNRVAGDSDGLVHRLSARLDGAILRRLQGVICHGPYLVDEITAVGVDQDRIHEFDVGFADYQAARLEYEQQPSADVDKPGRYLLFVGRLEVDKGIIELLEAASGLLQRDSTLRLVYAGDGNGRAALGQEISRLGLQEQVELLGRVPHAELVPLFVEALALVAPTRPGFPEGRCMSVMETLVLGRPAIVPDFGPFPYLITHDQDGLLFEPGSVDDLKRQLERLFEGEQLLQTLTAGAIATGEKLSTPPQTFNAAVEQAFAGGAARNAS